MRVANLKVLHGYIRGRQKPVQIVNCYHQKRRLASIVPRRCAVLSGGRRFAYFCYPVTRRQQIADRRRTAYSSLAIFTSSPSGCSPIWLESGLPPGLFYRQPIVKLVTFTLLPPPVEPVMAPPPEVVVFFEKKRGTSAYIVKQPDPHTSLHDQP